MEGRLVDYQIFRIIAFPQYESYKIRFYDFCQTSEQYFQETSNKWAADIIVKMNLTKSFSMISVKPQNYIFKKPATKDQLTLYMRISSKFLAIE